MLDLTCPHCHRRVSARPEQAGQRFDCPHCDRKFKIPGSAGPAADVDDGFFHFDERPADSAAPDDWSFGDDRPLRKPGGDNVVSNDDAPREQLATNEFADARREGADIDDGIVIGANDRSRRGDADDEDSLFPSSAAAASSPSDEWNGEEGLDWKVDAPTRDPQLDGPGLNGPVLNDAALVDAGLNDAAASPAANDDPFGGDLSHFEKSGALLGAGATGGTSRPTSKAGGDAGDGFLEVGLPPGGAGPARPVTAADDDPEIGVSCPVCESRLAVRRSKVGKMTRCPDCESQFEVPAPKSAATFHPAPKQAAPSDKSQREKERPESGGEKKQTSHRSEAVSKKVANDMLQQAAKELDEKGDEDRADYYDDIPNVGNWFREVAGFLADPNAIARLLLFSAGLWLLAFIADVGLGEESNLILHLMTRVVHVVFGIPMLAFLGVHCLTILEEAARGPRAVENWPGFDVADWLGQSLYFVNSFVLAILPGWILLQGVKLIGGPVSIGLAAMVFSGFLLFPVIMLSMLERGSPWIPYSKIVLESIARHTEPVGGFLFPSALMAFIAWVLLALMALFGAMVDAVSSFGLVAMAFVYFRMLGRLTFHISKLDDRPTTNLRAKRTETDEAEDTGHATSQSSS